MYHTPNHHGFTGLIALIKLLSNNTYIKGNIYKYILLYILNVIFLVGKIVPNNHIKRQNNMFLCLQTLVIGPQP